MVDEALVAACTLGSPVIKKGIYRRVSASVMSRLGRLLPPLLGFRPCSCYVAIGETPSPVARLPALLLFLASSALCAAWK